MGYVIAGIDEAGRGPLAGPVTAACVVLKDGFNSPLFRDSKQLSAKQRELAYDEVVNNALVWSVVAVGHRRIDQLNIREATRLAMRLAAARVESKLENLGMRQPVHFLIDGNMNFSDRGKQEPIIKGDQKVAEISAASIVAKVTRDRLMANLDKKYPGYGFAIHKGYPTATHRRAVAVNGPCRVHRLTFSGVKEHVQGYTDKFSASSERGLLLEA